MRRLRLLSLHRNFTGTLPAQWSVFLNLTNMGLGNKLTGTLPSEWSALTGLRSMYLEDNKLHGTLPEQWSTMVHLRAVRMSANYLSGTLPAHWSNLPTQEWYLGINRFSGTLPPQWSRNTKLQYLVLSANRFTGSLPPSWSELVMLRQMAIGANMITGSLPPSWSTLTRLSRLSLVQNALSGPLPAEWSVAAANYLNYVLLDFNLLTGELPSWRRSNAAPEVAPVPSGQPAASNSTAGRTTNTAVPDTPTAEAVIEAGGLPENAAKVGVEYEYTTTPPGALTPDSPSASSPSPAPSTEEDETQDTYLHEDENTYLFGPDGDLYGDYYGGLAYDGLGGSTPTESLEVGVRFNLLTGSMPPPTDSPRVIHTEFNCDIKGAPAQSFCPPVGLSSLLLLATLLTPVTICGILVVRRGRSRFLADMWFAVGRAQWRHVPNKMLMVIVAVSMAWDMLSWSPHYYRLVHFMALLVPAYLTQVTYVTFSELGSTMQPPAVLLLVVWWVSRAVISCLGHPDVSAWTIMASKDVMKGNLRVLREDQALVLLICVFIACLTSLSNWLVLPKYIEGWISVRAQHPWLPPVWIEARQEVPADAITLFYASFAVVVYQMVSTVSLPPQLWCNKSVTLALKADSQLRHSSKSRSAPPARAGIQPDELMGAEMLSLLRPIRRLRLAHWVTLTMLTLFCTFSTAAVMAYSSHSRQGVSSLTYRLENVVVTIGASPVPTALAAACLSCQVLILGTFNVLVWGGELRDIIDARWSDKASPQPEGQANAPPTGTWHNRCRTALGRVGRIALKGLRKMVTTKRMGRSHLRRNLLLAVFGLTMVPASTSSTGGMPMAIIMWVICNGLLVCAAVARDEPSGFEDLVGNEGFGLVMLARDLAEALEADLLGHGPLMSSLADKVPRPHIHHQHHHKPCGGGAPPGSSAANPSRLPATRQCSCIDCPAGCPRCQLLIRRFPATLFRMQETLALSYRWQQGKHVLVCPEERDPYSPGFDPEYFRYGTVSVNMCRWQRQELLAALRTNGHTYVWVDALCIPAALEPAPGTPLARMSSVLLTRMMALYSAAATTLVLRSLEEEGLRYHQRAWTMQEFCCAREIIVRSEGGPAASSPRHANAAADLSPVPSEADRAAVAPVSCSHTAEEEGQFRLRRREVNRRILFALPFWVRRMDASAFRGDTELLRYGMREYSVARRQVSCWQPADLVRALVPMFMNTSVQDEDELRLLVQWAYDGRPEGTTDEEQEAMLEASSLLQPSGGSPA